MFMMVTVFVILNFIIYYLAFRSETLTIINEVDSMKLSALLCNVVVTAGVLVLLVVPAQGFPDADKSPWHQDTYPSEEIASARRSKSLDSSVCDTLKGQEFGTCQACFRTAEADLKLASKHCGDSDEDCLRDATKQHRQKTLQCSRQLLVRQSSWAPPEETDQRGPCPFINTLANHGIIHRDGRFIDLLDLAVRLEAVYNVHRDFLNGGPVQLAIDCHQTYTDENGIIRLDLERLFNAECEEHEASMVRADRYYGLEKSKLVDPSLLDSLDAVNPTSYVLTKQNVMEYQVARIQDSGNNNPETVFRPDFDYANMGAQGVFLFLLSDDPTLETVDKSVLYSFLLSEKLPDNFVPGSLRDTPFNFLDPDDFSKARFEESMANVQNAVEAEFMHLVQAP